MSRLHRRAAGRIIFLAAFMLFGALPTHAQQTPSSGNDPVNIAFTVTDKDQHSVTTLRQEDVRVLEDGLPQEVTAFQRQTDQPIALLIMIDTSISQERTLPNQKTAAAVFVDSFIRQSKDQAAIITFSDHATLEQALTNDLSKLRQAIARVEFKPPPDYVGRGQIAVGPWPPITRSNQRPPPGSTTIWDAVWAASDNLLSQTSEKSRRAIILITDGTDTASRRKLNEAIECALRIKVAIYTIGIGDEEIGGVERGPLQKLAEQTGGRAFIPKKWDELRADFEEIERELNAQYVITYSPTSRKSGGKFHKVQIEIVNPELRKQGLRLAYPHGYSPKSG